MKYKSAKVPRRLAFAQTAINVAMKNKAVSRALVLLGYDDEKMDEGNRLLNYAMKMQGSLEMDDRPETPAAIEERFKKDRDRFWELKTVATVALKLKHQLIIDLFIDRPIDTTIAGFFRQAEHFYDAIIGNTIITRELARFNIDDNTLIEAKIHLEKTQDAYKEHFSELGDALNAVRIRDDAMKSLDSWMEDFITISQVALRKSPDLLAEMGFKAR
ncbi:hypothetical protein KKF84_21950 [Myxococcota bacterium]|nr:hypothetical protein [Myxococcota bacterium]